MKNITISVTDELYRAVRVRAAERDTTVSALVRGYLEQLACDKSEFERLKRLEAETIASIENFSAGDRLTREEVHDRDALRRLEYSAVRDK